MGNPSSNLEMIADQVGDFLYDRCGWRPSGDAQWQRLKAALPELAKLLNSSVETQGKPVAWRRLTDSAYENHPRYVYADVPIPGGTPLYEHPALETSGESKAETALRGLYWDQVDYLTINKLGGLDNHWMRVARDALGIKRDATIPGRPELRHDSPEVQFADVFAELDKGHPVNTRDAINALWWKVRNQRREIARLHEKRAPETTAPRCTCGPSDIHMECPIHGAKSVPIDRQCVCFGMLGCQICGGSGQLPLETTTGAPPKGITWLTRGKPDFAHWRKDSSVPYDWCGCVSCNDARGAVKASGNPSISKAEPLV